MDSTFGINGCAKSLWKAYLSTLSCLLPGCCLVSQNAPFCVKDAGLSEGMLWSNPIKELPEPAPNIWNILGMEWIYDEVSTGFYQHMIPEHVSWNQQVPSYAFVDRKTYRNQKRNLIWVVWRKKKVYTAYIGWENGEIYCQPFLNDSFKLPP